MSDSNRYTHERERERETEHVDYMHDCTGSIHRIHVFSMSVYISPVLDCGCWYSEYG